MQHDRFHSVERGVIRSLLVWLAAVSFVSLGAGAALAPEALSENYGLPIEDAAGRGYIRAVGARDAILGLLLGIFAQRRDHTALATVLGVSALAGAADFSIVRSTRGMEAPASLVIHATGTAGLAILAVLCANAAE